MADFLDGQTLPQHYLVISWACQQRDCRGSSGFIDIYRREGDKLAENWIFIDMLHFWKMQGLDILEQAREAPNT